MTRNRPPRSSKWLLCLLLCIACTKGQSLMPGSGGRPYEVLVVGADSEAVVLTATALRSIEAEALPQREPMFSVSTIVSDGLSQATRYARNIVMVTTGHDSLLRPSITYQRNVYARQQLLVSLHAATKQQLRVHINNNVRAIGRLLQRQETDNGVAQLRQRHNEQAGKLAREMFGATLWIPQDLDKWKRGRDYLWFSNDALRGGLQNICIYRYAGNRLEPALLVAKRDSVMRSNMPGEAQGSYMMTVAATVRTHRISERRMLLRGLWEMQGDAMGGPFVCVAVPQGDSTVVAEAFVYAPGLKKQPLVSRLEACLHTLNFEY